MTNALIYTIICDMKKSKRNSDECRVLGKNNLEVNSYTRAFDREKVLLHRHLFFEINLCLNGEFINEINEESVIFRKRSCAILSPKDCHRFLQTDEKTSYRHRDVYVPVEKMKKCCDFLSPTLYEKINSSDAPICFSLTSKEFDLINEMLETVENRMHYDADLAEELHVTAIIQILALYEKSLSNCNKTTFPDWLNILLEQLDETENLLLSEPIVAAQFGYTTSHFSREFKKYMKIPYVKYVSLKKAQIAANMLINTEKQVLEISQSLGYASPSPFNKHFNEVFNCSPSQYRKNFTLK